MAKRLPTQRAVRSGRASAARNLTIAAIALVAVLATASPARAAAPLAVWIDTDPVCGRSPTDDVDDCWALVQALAAPELAVRGISTVFGNADGAVTHATARVLLDRMSRTPGAAAGVPPLHRGSGRPVAEEERQTDASRALADALRAEPLTVIALGPLTNIAAVLNREPRLAGRIAAVIAVAGKRPGQSFRPGGSRLLHFHDLNFRKDPDAFATVLALVPVVLLPFEAASQVTVTAADLERLARGGPAGRWLAGISGGWLEFWRDWFGHDGFHPFDSLAVGYAIAPRQFTCERLGARITRRRSLFVPRDDLELSPDFAGMPQATYCSGVAPGFKAALITHLAASGRRRPTPLFAKEETKR